jgi:hypothetical protein
VEKSSKKGNEMVSVAKTKELSMKLFDLTLGSNFIPKFLVIGPISSD